MQVDPMIYILLHVIVIIFIRTMYVDQKAGAQLFLTSIFLMCAVAVIHIINFIKWII